MDSAVDVGYRSLLTRDCRDFFVNDFTGWTAAIDS